MFLLITHVNVWKPTDVNFYLCSVNYYISITLSYNIRLFGKSSEFGAGSATDWQDSIIINCYKGKGDATDRGNYRGRKLPNPKQVVSI